MCDTKTNTAKVEELPRKKLKTCKEEKNDTPKESENCAVVPTEPLFAEEKGEQPDQPEDTLNIDSPMHYSQKCDISLTFPETPPSFELDPVEQEIV